MNFSTETSPDTQLILDELRKLSAMQSELFADLAVCISRVAAPSAAAISRVAAPSTAAVSPVPVPLIVADNWDGLFDGGDDPDEQQPEAPIVADSWGGIFEQPNHILDERESIEQIRVESGLASTNSDVIFAELASTDHICVEGAYTFPNLDAPACLTPASIVSAAAASVPVDISLAKCAQFEEKLQVTNIADLEEALPKRETGMRALAVAGPFRLDVSLVAPAPEAVSNSELYGTAKAPTLLASSIAALDCPTASLAQRLPRSTNSIHHEYGLTPSFPNRIRNPCAKDDDDLDNPGVEVAGLFRKLGLNGVEDITTVLGGYDSSLDDDPATCFVHFDAPLDRAVGRVGQALAGAAVFRADAVGAAGGGLLARVVDARSAQSTCSTVCLAGDCNFADVLVGVLWKEEMLRWNCNMYLCDAHGCCGSVGLILDPDPCRHSHYLVAPVHQHDLVLHGDRLLCYTTTLVVAAALSKCGAHSVHAEIVFDKMWIKSNEKLVCAVAETASVRALKDVDDSSSGVERLILELLLLPAVPMKHVSRDGVVYREFVRLLLSVCSYMLHQSCIVTWLRRSTLSCYIEFQPWALPVQFEQSEGVQFRCVLSDFAVPWKYMIIAVRFIVIPSVVGMSLLGSVVVDTLMLSYKIIGLISPLKPVSPGGFEFLVFRQEAFNLLTLYVPNMYCMVGHYWVLSDASIHASLTELCVILRSVWSGLVDAHYTVIVRQAVAILLWPSLDELRLTSCDAELQPTPWSSFTMAELFSVRSYYGQLGKPPWPIQICQHISLLLFQLKRHVPVSEIIPMSTTTGSDRLKCGGHFVPIFVTRIGIRFWSKQGNSDTEACLHRNDPNHDSCEEPVDLVDVTVSTTLEDYKQYAILLFERYFSNGDVRLPASDLNKLGYNDFLQNFVKKLVYTATDRHDKEEEIELVLLSYPYGNVISSTHITVEEVKKRIADLLQEYIRNGDTTEACRCISEWAVHLFHQKLVNQAFTLEMESPSAKAPIVILLPALQKHMIVRFSWDPGGSQLLLSVSMADCAPTQEQVQRKCGGNCEDDSIVYGIKNLQVPWDPGGFELLHRLEGKPKLKKGGMLGTSNGWADPWALALILAQTLLEEYKGMEARKEWGSNNYQSNRQVVNSLLVSLPINLPTPFRVVPRRSIEFRVTTTETVFCAAAAADRLESAAAAEVIMSHKAAATTMPPMMTLEVKVVNGEDVRVQSGRPLCHGAYAVVHTASSSATTRVDQDPDCHGYPYWDEAVRVALPAGARWLDVQICRAHAGGKPETVAAARVPVEDFTVGPPGHLHCLSYRLFGSGMAKRRNGIVNITVKRVDGVAPRPAAEGKAVYAPAGGKAVVDAAGPSGSGSGSCCGAAAAVEQGKPAAPAGAVMGYPVGC